MKITPLNLITLPGCHQCASRNLMIFSVLPHVSKAFERIKYHQINDYMKEKLSKQLTGFRENLSTQLLELYARNMEKSFR